MTNLDSIFKSSDITMPTKVHPVNAMVFPVVMYGCENWTIKKLSVEELMLSNWGVGEDSRESLRSQDIEAVNHEGNQSWIFIGRTDAEAETPILWPLNVKNCFMWKNLILGKIEGRRKRGWQRIRCLDNITDLIDMSLSKLQSLVMNMEAWSSAVFGVAKSQT